MSKDYYQGIESVSEDRLEQVTGEDPDIDEYLPGHDDSTAYDSVALGLLEILKNRQSIPKNNATIGEILNSKKQYWQGYSKTLATLSKALCLGNKLQSPGEEDFYNALDLQIMQWNTQREDKKSVLDYVESQTQKGTVFSLNPIPNIPEHLLYGKDASQIVIRTLKAFVEEDSSKKLSKTTRYIEDDWCSNYTKEQIFGKLATGDDVQISFELVPTSYNREHPQSLEDQQKELTRLQRDNQSAKLHVSTPWAQVSRFHTLRELYSGDDLRNYNLTHIRDLVAPYHESFIHHDGTVVAVKRPSNIGNCLRLSVG